MLYSLPPATGYQLPGVKTLLLAPWSGAAIYSYASEARSHITSFSGLTDWEFVSCEGGADFSQVSAQSKNGKLYAQTLNVTVAGLSDERRTAVEALLAAGPVVALVQDFNSLWWLYGQTAGLRLLTATAKEATTALPLAGTQSEAARTVAKARVALLNNSLTVFHLPE